MIHARGLARRFTTKKQTVDAVKGIDIDVNAGDLVAFLGPNGAGKSTTLRMLTTLLRPTSGMAEVAGRDVVADPVGVRARIGYIGQGNGAGHTSKVRDELIDQGVFYGMTRQDARRRAGELLVDMNIDDLAKRAVMSLSGGQRRRLDIALGMMHHPSLLFLDEPSTGLDPQNRANLAAQVKRLRAEFGMTIVLTTHYLEEADQLAERVVIIDEGAIIADGTPAELKATLAGDQMRIGCGNEIDAKAAAEVAERLETVRDITVDDAALRFAVRDGEAMLPNLLRDLDSRGITVTTASVTVPTLDDVFLALTGRTLRDADQAETGD